MLHTIEGPYVNHCDPWQKKGSFDDLEFSKTISSNTIYLPEFTLSFVNGESGRVSCLENSEIKSDYEYILILQLSGCCHVYEETGKVKIEQGEMLLLSSLSGWKLEFENTFSQIVLRFHYAYITPLVSVKDIPLMTTFTSNIGIGRLLLDYLIRLNSELNLRNISQSSAVPLSRSIINLIVACILEVNDGSNKKYSATYEYHISRIKNYIAQNLREPTLSIELISNTLKISTPHLHRIFKNEPMSISHYIWSKRLQGCVKDLSEYSKSHESISTIAFSWGFNDAAHFSRVFKEHYGVSPSVWRKAKLNSDKK